MKFAREIKCILCLIKCSKYLYYLKKILCFITISILAFTVISAFGNDNKGVIKKMKGLIK